MSAMFEAKIKKLKDQLKKEKLDAVFISSVSNISYLTGYTNFSKDEREAYILVGNNFQYIITDGRYSEAIKKEVSHLKLYERGFENSTEDLLKSLKGKIKTLGIEEDNLTVAEHKAIKKHFKNLKHFEVSNLRSIKEKWEIQKIKKACELGDKTFKFILGKIKVGVTEKQVAQELEKFIEENGAEFSFPPIVAFGKNSSIPHHQTSNKRLTINDKLILLDFGVRWENYCSDMTRTIFFGKPDSKQKKIYEAVLKTQQEAVKFIEFSIKAGKQLKASDVDKVARDYIISKGYPSIPHSLGHGVGLEVHEHPHLSPKSKEVLKEGMVFSIEPGIYLPAGRYGIPDFGGVRIEDLFILQKDGLKQITNSPKNLIIV